MKGIFFLLSIAVMLLLSSCSSRKKQEVDPQQDYESIIKNMVVKYAVIPDSARCVDSDVISENDRMKTKIYLLSGSALLPYIEIENRTYIINIDRDKAWTDLGVPDWAYDYHSECLNNTNRMIFEAEENGDTIEPMLPSEVCKFLQI